MLVNADGDLRRIAHTQQPNESWQLSVAESVPIGSLDVVGVVPDYSGNVLFATAQGTTSLAGAVVGYDSPTSSQTYAYTLPAGEAIANSISSWPGGVAIASTAALYVLEATTTGGVTETWRQAYDRGPARKSAQMSWGTGSTPAFFGPDTGFEYITITNNASPQESILVWTETGPHGRR